jgi:hypothetical protein
MLCREIIAVYCESHKTDKYTVWAQRAIFHVKGGGSWNNISLSRRRWKQSLTKWMVTLFTAAILYRQHSL